MQRLREWSFSAALAVSLICGSLLGQSSLATAQPATPANDPAFFSATGYRIGSPAMLDYFQHRGGVRTFGYPVSSEFPLKGHRVQLFQRQLLEVRADGSVGPVNILDAGILPITHIDGLSLPASDPDLLGAAPTPDNPDYTTQALSFISVYVPDQWNGLPVNFQTTLLNTVSCADAFGTDDCDTSLLPALAIEVWGLPTSLPTADPLNTGFVYQRFQRGIMHYSATTGQTQGLLLGDWLKRIMVGVDLSPDLNLDVRRSPYFAQYAPSRPLALDRPADLPDTSLAQAFKSDTLTAAGQMQPEPTLPLNVAQTATAVAQTATAVSATQLAFQGTQSILTATSLALTATAAVSAQTPTPTPGAAVSDIPVVNVGCLGDEQMWFLPRRPNIGVHVEISVTSRRHHDARAIRLTGPLDSGPVTERVGPLGFIWTWTVVPAVEAFHEWTFYADGLRPCITSGFNAFAPLGATITPTPSPVPSNTPGPTGTPTNTVVPQPVVSSVTPLSGPCGGVITVFGHGFGAPPSTFSTQVIFAGPEGSFNAAPNGGSDTSMSVTVPSNMSANTRHTIQVVSNGGASNTIEFTTTNCNIAGAATDTPVPQQPTLTGVNPGQGACGTIVTLSGTNFGSPPSSRNTQIFFSGAGGTFSASVNGGSNTSVSVTVPRGLTAGATYQVQVVNDGGATGTQGFTVTTCTA